MKQNLIDAAEFSVKAGKGGDGSVHFRREKYVPKGGPDGGDGGKGGSIYLESDVHLRTLREYAGKDRFLADLGQPGGKRKRHGEDADDLILKVPVGTQVFEILGDGELVLLADLDTGGEKLLVAKGGKGGRGNTAFKSSTNTTPMEAERGEPGEKRRLKLELKLLADLGLVGMPNAGKSTLLSILTAAKPEVANYPFTTTSPNLGVMMGGKNKDIVLADIPGLIEQAHEGKGLGINFLKHIERCRGLIMVLAPLNEGDLNGDLSALLISQYEVLMQELSAYSKELTDKPRLVVVNKTDLMNEKTLKDVEAKLAKKFEEPKFISAATTKGIEELREKLVDWVFGD